MPILKAQSNLTFTNGDSTGTIKFPATGCLYQWKNNNPSIGLIKSGSGDIESFKAINTGRVPITATITTNPVRELAYIASESNGTISVINTVTGHVDAKLSFSNFANYSVCVKPGGTAVYVSSGGSKVINVINTSTNLFSATITLDVFPNYLLASPDGNKLYVSSFTGGKVEVINTLTNTIISTIKQDSASTMAISPDGLKLYVGNVSTGKISVFNTADNTKIGSIETFGASNNPAKAIGSFLSFMVISPDGKELYGSAYGNNSYSNSLIVADLQKNLYRTKIDVGMVPLVITITEDGSRIYTGNQLSNTVSIVNTTTKAVIDSIAVPNQPASVCLNSDETRLYVTNFQSNTVTVINTANNKILYTITVDKGPTAGNNFIADLPNCAPPGSFTITVNPNPTAISAKGNVTALTTVYGTPSATGTFSLSGTNLGEGILINAPAGFEVSADSLKFSKTLLVGSAGDITPRKIYVRLAAAANGCTYNDVITLTSAGATSVNVPVTGIITPAALTIAAKHIVKFYGAINPELIIIYTGFKNKDGANQLTTQPLVYTTATTTSPIGVYPITVSSAISANYKFLYVNNTLDIATGLQFPNTFTPNNDGINDNWIVKYIEAYPKARVEIFNRYGNKVYNSQANFAGWDGKFNGTDLPAGTYYYIIRPNDGTKPISGPVSIIR